MKNNLLRNVVPNSAHVKSILAHERKHWGAPSNIRRLTTGRTDELPSDFAVAEYPRRDRDYWIYATIGMSQPSDASGLELFVLASKASQLHVETLTAIAHYHRTGAQLGVGHTVNLGRPWLDGSRCEYGLISLPYVHGPELEYADIGDRTVRFLWLIPVTASEVAFKKKRGLEALEQRFEERGFNYLDPSRPPVA